MGYKNDLIHLKVYVLTFDIQSFCDKVCYHDSLQVMKFVYCHSTYILPLLNMGLNINLSQIKKLGVFRLAYCLSVLNMVWNHDSGMETK